MIYRTAVIYDSSWYDSPSASWMSSSDSGFEVGESSQSGIVNEDGRQSGDVHMGMIAHFFPQFCYP